MSLGEDLLSVLLVVAALVFGARALVPAAALGRAGPAMPCPRPVARPEGVTCLSADDAARLGARAGQGMQPDALAAWGVALDPNRASVAELASLEGIGPALAARIAAARPFASLDDLARVKGIGARRLARLRPRLTLDERR
jgi:predicted flap endonuclease-1-like 5' DNA nuclease